MKSTILTRLFFVLFVNQCFALSGQNREQLPRDYFDPPVDIPIYLAGNFGEIRGNHFHAGIDIKTDQVEGLPVYAVAGGYVSRIKIGIFGYGKAVYIAHPNGYTTAYAHLQRLNDDLEQYIRSKQYLQKSYEVDIHPKPGELNIKRGEKIAYSGNTGGSGGPHLHFEIRESSGQTPVNPLLFNFDIKDTRKPVIKTVSLYPLNDTSTVNGKNEPLHISVRGARGNYQLPGPMDLTASGVIGAGIETIDRMNGTGNRLGAYQVSLLSDGDTAYSHKMFRIPFALTRYINAHIDYYQTKKYRRRVQKSYLEPNNKLNIYNNVQVNGKLFFSSYDHDLRYVVKDAHGNESSVSFLVKAEHNVTRVEKNESDEAIRFSYKRANVFKNEDIQVEVPAYSLYNNLDFVYSKEPPAAGAYADVHHLSDLYTPLHKYMTVKIKLHKKAARVLNKLYAVSLDDQMEVISAEGGSAAGNDWFVFKTRSFGPYTVMADTIAPEIALKLKGRGNEVLTEGEKIVFYVEDKESGIDSFRIFINGEWALPEYDYKTNELWYEVDPGRLEKGMHELKVAVTDKTGNRSVKTVEFSYK